MSDAVKYTHPQRSTKSQDTLAKLVTACGKVYHGRVAAGQRGGKTGNKIVLLFEIDPRVAA